MSIIIFQRGPITMIPLPYMPNDQTLEVELVVKILSMLCVGTMVNPMLPLGIESETHNLAVSSNGYAFIGPLPKRVHEELLVLTVVV